MNHNKYDMLSVLDPVWAALKNCGSLMEDGEVYTTPTNYVDTEKLVFMFLSRIVSEHGAKVRIVPFPRIDSIQVTIENSSGSIKCVDSCNMLVLALARTISRWLHYTHQHMKTSGEGCDSILTNG